MTRADKKSVVRCNDLHKSFPSKSGKGKLRVLQGVTLEVKEAEIVSIIGSSGSGKSTLLHILGGLDRADSGHVYWHDTDIFSLKSDDLANKRNANVGFVFQFHHLLPEFTALENVFMPALIRGDSPSEAEPHAAGLLDRFGLSDRLDHRPSQLSGGEQQRVSMARALMNNPSIILADEPTGNLDEENTNIILDELFQLREIDHVSIVLITHEKVIAEQCDRVYKLVHGQLE